MESKNPNIEGVIIIRDKDGHVVGFVRKDTDVPRPIIYKAEEMNFSDLEELFKS